MKEQVDLNLDKWVQESCFMSALTSDSEETKTFSETWNHQEPKIRNMWREAIKKELSNIWSTRKFGQRNKRMKFQETRLVDANGCLK